MAALAEVALFVSSLGIYAVVSYSVVRRCTREIGMTHGVRSPFGPRVVVALTLASVALAVMAAPAYRASKADPLTALRHD